jgi:hypothetical protein
MWLHQMHHRRQIQQAPTAQTGDDDAKKHKGLHLETSLLLLSPFASLPTLKMTVRSVAVSLTCKTRLEITEGCSQSLLIRAVLKLDSIKRKCNKSIERLKPFNDL